MDTTLARLERIPLSRPHRRLLLQGGLGYMFDAADGAVVSFLLAVLTTLWDLNSAQTGLLASSGLWGFAIGALIAGQLADRLGRKQVMMYALAFYAVFSVMAALSNSWDVFFWCRVLAGVGLGAESAVIAPFLSEFVPSRARGRYIGFLSVFFAFGFVAAALLSNVLVPLDEGWRWVQIATAAPILMLLIWRRVLPESPRFLLARGRHAEATAVVEKFEAQYEKATGRKLPPVTAPPVDSIVLAQEAPKRIGLLRSILALFSTAAMTRRTLVSCALWFIVTFAFYGFNIWIPSLLVNEGYSLSSSFTYVLLFYIAQIPGYLSAALLNDRADRKWTSAIYLTAAVIATIIMGNVNGATAVIAAGMALSFCLTGVYASLYTFTPELYPTRVRVTGMSVSTAFGRLGGIIAAMFVPVVLAGYGFSAVFTMQAAVLLIGAVIVAVLGISTAGHTLEDLNEGSGDDTKPDEDLVRA